MKRFEWRVNWGSVVIAISLLCFSIYLGACKEPPVPKPRGYFRIDFPDKQYERFQSNCGYSFEVPVYSDITPSSVRTAEACWYDLSFPNYNATVYLTYKPLLLDLSSHVEDVRRIVYKHIIKADDIVEQKVNIPDHQVYGIVYHISGNTASALNFYLTDSSSGFVSGALYFNVSPNKDSLAPAIDFFSRDILHLINTFEWE
jgi:gliding motility-associated lipoprotein GldD